MSARSERKDANIGAHQPGEAGKSFEALFGAGDLDGLMDLYEPDAVFTNRKPDDGSWKFVIDNPDGPALIDHA